MALFNSLFLIKVFISIVFVMKFGIGWGVCICILFFMLCVNFNKWLVLLCKFVCVVMVWLNCSSVFFSCIFFSAGNVFVIFVIVCKIWKFRKICFVMLGCCIFIVMFMVLFLFKLSLRGWASVEYIAAIFLRKRVLYIWVIEFDVMGFCGNCVKINFGLKLNLFVKICNVCLYECCGVLLWSCSSWWYRFFGKTFLRVFVYCVYLMNVVLYSVIVLCMVVYVCFCMFVFNGLGVFWFRSNKGTVNVSTGSYVINRYVARIKRVMEKFWVV